MEATEVTQLRSLLEAQTRLRELAERGYAEVLATLWRIARQALPEEVDAAQRRDPAFRDTPPRPLGDWILERLVAKHRRMRMLSRGDLADQVEAALGRAGQAEAEVVRLQGQVEELQQRVQQTSTLQTQLAASHAEAAQLRQQNEGLRAEVLQRAASPQPAAVEAGPMPGPDEIWFNEWQARPTFETDAALLRLMGDTGLALRSSLAQALHRAGHLGSADGGAVGRIIRRLKDTKLVDATVPDVVQAGRPPQILQLTDRGREAYRRLTGGQEPQEPEYGRLLGRGRVPEHVLLTLEARDALLAHGAQAVDAHSPPVALAGGEALDPNLVAIFDGQALYVQCDWRIGSEGDDRAQRYRRFGRHAQVTSDFYVVVRGIKAQSEIMSEANKWSLDTGLRRTITLHVCNLDKLKHGGPLWGYERSVQIFK